MRIFPMVPVPIALSVFGLLAVLLIHKEVMRALGRPLSRQTMLITNSAIGVLLVLYGVILLSRFINLVM